jgi:acyl-CoA thioester hydrolase
VVSLSIDYRRPLRHGDQVVVWSEAEPPRGARLPWRSRFESPAGEVAAEARVELVALERQEGRQRVLRRLPADLQRAVQALTEGPHPL